MRRGGGVGALVISGMLVIALAGCGSSEDNAAVIHVVEGEAETRVAQTAWAQAHPSATPGPSPTPLPEGTPYVMPTLAPDVDPQMVITRVGNEQITLEQFQKQVRFERWYRLYQLAKLTEKHGTAAILDLTKPENQMVSSLFATLADSNSFGIQVQRIMVVDAIARQEAARRDLDVETPQFDAKMGQFLLYTVGEGGGLPPEFYEEYPRFIAEMTQYTGMTEEEFRRIVRARALYAQLEWLISQEPAAVPKDQEAEVGKEVQDILVGTKAEADEVVRRLGAGETMREIAASLGLQATSQDASRVLRWSDPNLPREVIEAVYVAAEGEIIGPLATPQGWFVALVGPEVFDVLSPQDIEALRKNYYLQWIENKMDDPAYVEDFDNWLAYIPQEPLPQDVSPYLRDEYVILPEGVPDPLGLELTEEPGTPETPPSPETTPEATAAAE